MIQKVVGFVAVGAAATAIYLHSRNQDAQTRQEETVATSTAVTMTRGKTIPSPEQSARQKEDAPSLRELKEDDERITGIETAFIRFAQDISEKAKKYSASHVDELKIPLDAVKANSDNKQKNLRAMKTHLTDGYARIHQDSPAHFYYAFHSFPDGAGPAASFSDISREITLNTKFDTKNLQDMFLLFHELLHVKQDEERRGRMKTDFPGYADALMLPVNAPVKVAFLNDEARAHALTLEAINAYFDGALEKLGEKAAPKDIARLFGFKLADDRSQNREFAHMFTQETQAYFEHGKDKTTRDENLWQLVGKAHLQSGMELYNLDPKGYPYPLQVISKKK